MLFQIEVELVDWVFVVLQLRLVFPLQISVAMLQQKRAIQRRLHRVAVVVVLVLQEGMEDVTPIPIAVTEQQRCSAILAQEVR
jgi:hypothetical protein